MLSGLRNRFKNDIGSKTLLSFNPRIRFKLYFCNAVNVVINLTLKVTMDI